MVILGVILLLVGLVANIYILWVIGIVLIIVGAILWLMAAHYPDRRYAGRRYWY
jgi:uncharacterized membrane protein HdeD (DUF308 family)